MKGDLRWRVQEILLMQRLKLGPSWEPRILMTLYGCEIREPENPRNIIVGREHFLSVAPGRDELPTTGGK